MQENRLSGWSSGPGSVRGQALRVAGREEDVLAREREVVAQGQPLVVVQSVAWSATEVLEELTRGLEHATFDQRRRLVELLIDRVVATDDAVEIRYVIPTTEASTHTPSCQLR